MKVKALDAGFYAGNRVRAGQVFEVPEGTKAKWFVAVDEIKADEAPKGPKARKKDEPATLSQAGKQDAQTFADVHGSKADLA